jgi:hypothetical protein
MSETTWVDKRDGGAYVYEPMGWKPKSWWWIALIVGIGASYLWLGLFVTLVGATAQSASPASGPEPIIGIPLTMVFLAMVVYMLQQSIHIRKRSIVCPYCAGKIPDGTLGRWGH